MLQDIEDINRPTKRKRLWIVATLKNGYMVTLTVSSRRWWRKHQIAVISRARLHDQGQWSLTTDQETKTVGPDVMSWAAGCMEEGETIYLAQLWRRPQPTPEALSFATGQPKKRCSVSSAPRGQ